MTTPIGDPAALPLGALPPKDDPRTLLLARYRTPQLPAPPVTSDWTTAVPHWPMFANDRHGCCTCAAAGHAIGGWSTNTAHPQWITDADVLGAYAAVSGFDPLTGARDNGAYLLDVLNLWRRRGVGGHRITAFVQVNHLDEVEVRQAVHLFGAVYSGVALPLAAQDQLRTHRTWATTKGGRGRAGSWGGHAVSLFAYNQTGPTCVTWGNTQPMTWAWWRKYAREAYAIVSPDWIDVVGSSPTGLNVARLMDDLHALGG